jgi:iron complex outermembrane receptor protein
VATADFEPQKQSDNIYSVFVQDKVAIVRNKLWATLGSKFEHNIYTGWETQPSARLLWTPSSHQTFWAAVTRAVRSPSRLDEDLQLTGLVSAAPPYPIFLEVAGNPKFASERLLGYEAGYRTLITSRFYFDISAFFNNYNNLTGFGAASITFAQSPPPSYTYLLITVPWANALIGNTDGAEITPNWKVTNWWQLKGSYSYLQMHLKDKAGITDASTAATDVGSSPRHEVVIQSLFSLPKNFEFDPTYRYVSALPALAIPGYSTMDIHFGWRIAARVELSVVGQNLFQPVHYESGSSAGPNVGIKRSVYGKITWTREDR